MRSPTLSFSPLRDMNRDGDKKTERGILCSNCARLCKEAGQEERAGDDAPERGGGDGHGKRGMSRYPAIPEYKNSHPHACSRPPRPTHPGIRDHQLGQVGPRPSLSLPTAPLSCCSTGAEEMEEKKEEERSYR